jgi:EAL domain-containing protein (putative c-di-GMP-specific phosphodiesterase class I)
MMRESDTFARMGGDEFVAVFVDLQDKHDSVTLITRLLDVASRQVQLGDLKLNVSASVGVSFYPQPDEADADQLLRQADQAMYHAKLAGKNRYHLFDAEHDRNLRLRNETVERVRQALANQEFVLHYHPQVNLRAGKVIGVEALIRWQHPERGLVSPAVFVPLAEDSGLINDIGDWVFHTAAQQVTIWRQSLHSEFQISINKSPVQFLDVNHQPADWILHLQNTGLPGQAIVVEITEGLLLEASEKTAEHLLVFRDAGVQVAIDDFGTGYSALSYLNKFDIDYLKIDQSFVRNLNAESSDFVLCEAIIVMAHKLGLKVIAEGVETEMQRDLLASINCDFGQGYLFARPMSAEDFTERYASDQKND